MNVKTIKAKRTQNRRRFLLSGRPLFISPATVGRALALLSLFACVNPSTSDRLVSSRVRIQGTVVRQATSLPVTDTRVTFFVPNVRDKCGTLFTGTVILAPEEVVTNNLGGFNAEITIVGQSPGNYCIEATAMGVTVEKSGVMFRDLNDPAVDTVAIRIEVP